MPYPIPQKPYLCQDVLDGQYEDANEVFNKLKDINIDSRIKNVPRGIVFEGETAKKFSGVVTKAETSYAFIIRDNYQDVLFTHSSYNNEKEWLKLGYHKRVIFELAFNYRGAIAINIMRE